MSDEVDMANSLVEQAIDSGIAAVRKAAAKIPAGNPGECDACGEWSGRLVRWYCAPCRDKWGML